MPSSIQISSAFKTLKGNKHTDIVFFRINNICMDFDDRDDKERIQVIFLMFNEGKTG